jgi:hypothetical protein
MKIFRYMRYPETPNQYFYGRSTDYGLQAWDKKRGIWVDGRGLFGVDVTVCVLEVALMGAYSEGP